jgi:hypothetical protein
VLADLRVAGNPVAAGNPVPISGSITANIGTTNGLALDASVQAVRTALGSPFQAGGSIGNAAFGISGTLPPFASTPTVNLGTLNGAATAAGQTAVQAAPGTSAGTANAMQGVSGGVPVATTIRSAGTNRSATVTTTASTPMAANGSRQGWKIKNDGAVTVWVNFLGAATAAPGSGNIAIPAGGYLASEPGFVETGAMSAIATSGSVALTIVEF